MNPLTALWMKDLHALRNLRRILRRESVFKIVFILLFAAGMTAGFFVLFLDGFRFLDSLGGGGYMITRRLFSLFFLGLGAMLVTSNLVTTYSTVFRSRETTFLLNAPLDTRELVTYKYLESTLLSSWAFFFLIVPFAGAYAWHNQLGPDFALWTALFALPFLLLCGGLGTVLALLAVRWLPRHRGFWIALAAALLASLVATALRARPGPASDATFVLSRFLPGLQIAGHPLMPNHWTAEGIMALTSGAPARGLMFWLVLATNTALLGWIVQLVGGATFRAAYERVHAAGGERRRPEELLGGLDRRLQWLPSDVRGMILKDLRMFLRDPMQWSQALIFFGLLALYFSSFRSFHYDRLPDLWRNLVVFLNIFSVSSVICSLASRFVFPQLSLEGHSFWILGLAPTGMRRILFTKFALAALGMVTVSTALMALAAWMLHTGPVLGAICIGLALAISLSVTAMSTGLGAVFMDLKQPNPVAIISGFGGTMNLVLSLGLMLAAILPYGLAWHWHTLGRISDAQLALANLLATAWLLVLTVTATLTPLAIGLRSLRRREY